MCASRFLSVIFWAMSSASILLRLLSIEILSKRAIISPFLTIFPLRSTNSTRADTFDEMLTSLSFCVWARYGNVSLNLFKFCYHAWHRNRIVFSSRQSLSFIFARCTTNIPPAKMDNYYYDSYCIFFFILQSLQYYYHKLLQVSLMFAIFEPDF